MYIGCCDLLVTWSHGSRQLTRFMFFNAPKIPQENSVNFFEMYFFMYLLLITMNHINKHTFKNVHCVTFCLQIFDQLVNVFLRS